MPKNSQQKALPPKVAKPKVNERLEALMRIVVLIVSGIILGLWRILIIILSIANLVITLITGKRHRDMAEFCEHWNTEIYRYARYLTFVSNERPFPFTSMQKMSKFSG